MTATRIRFTAIVTDRLTQVRALDLSRSISKLAGWFRKPATSGRRKLFPFGLHRAHDVDAEFVGRFPTARRNRSRAAWRVYRATQKITFTVVVAIQVSYRWRRRWTGGS